MEVYNGCSFPQYTRYRLLGRVSKGSPLIYEHGVLSIRRYTRRRYVPGWKRRNINAEYPLSRRSHWYWNLVPHCCFRLCGFWHESSLRLVLLCPDLWCISCRSRIGRGHEITLRLHQKQHRIRWREYLL